MDDFPCLVDIYFHWGGHHCCFQFLRWSPEVNLVQNTNIGVFYFHTIMCIEKHHLEMHIIFPINIFIPEEFEHNKAVIRKSKDRQHNGQMKKDKRTNNHL